MSASRIPSTNDIDANMGKAHGGREDLRVGVQRLEVYETAADEVDCHGVATWAVLRQQRQLHVITEACQLTLKLPIIVTSLLTKMDMGIKLCAGPAPTWTNLPRRLTSQIPVCTQTSAPEHSTTRSIASSPRSPRPNFSMMYWPCTLSAETCATGSSDSRVASSSPLGPRPSSSG
jgi:hypothetical protein